MIVEHVFVTTLEGADALRLASQFLSSRGFEAANQGAFVVGADQQWNVLEMRRGKKTPGKAKSYVELPQQVRLEYDRGRVTLAASAVSLQEARAGSRKLKGRDAMQLGEMLSRIATNLQSLLVERVDPGSLNESWSQFEEGLHRDGVKRRRRRIIVALAIFFGFIGLIVMLGVLAATRNW